MRAHLQKVEKPSSLSWPRAVPYTVRKYLNENPHLPLLASSAKRLKTTGSRTGIVVVNGVYIAILKTRFVVLHSMYNALVVFSIKSATRVYKTLLAGESKSQGQELAVGPRPRSIQVCLKNGCWPVFKNVASALRFCPTQWPLKCVKIGKSSQLFYGAAHKRYVCVECHQRFNNVLDIINHVGYPAPA